MSRHANTETNMRPPSDHKGASRRPFRQSLKSGSRYVFYAALAVMGLLVAVFLPSTALAVPGSGDFVALQSEGGREITELYNMIAKICLAILIIVEGALLFAIIKFRRRSDDERPVQNHGDLRLEFAWTLGALAIQVWIGVATIDVMFETETKPDNIDMTVTAYADMWNWNFEYDPGEVDGENGNDSIFPSDEPLSHEDLVIPAHKNVQILVTSTDVIHAIFIPELGIKLDAVPGRYNSWWVRADGPLGQVRPDDHATVDRPERQLPQTRSGDVREGQDATSRRVSGLEQHVDYLSDRGGDPDDAEDTRYPMIDYEDSPYLGYNAIEYQGTCAELCGAGHWDMYFRAVVMTRSSFQQWYLDELEDEEVREGDVVYAQECATVGCHGADGTPDGSGVPSLVDNPVTVDDDQKDEHIRTVLEGPGAMPAFGSGPGAINDEELVNVINHERQTWGNDGSPVDEEDVLRVRDELGLEAHPAVDIDPVPTDDLMADGERLYRSCAGCHGDDGRGPDYIPDIAGSDVVVEDDPVEVTRLLEEGRDTDEWPGSKRPVARSLGDTELAALLTYMRQSFDNDASVVQPFEIHEIRDELTRTAEQ